MSNSEATYHTHYKSNKSKKNLKSRSTFKDHVEILCSTANYKHHVLRRIRTYLTLQKAKLYNAFVIWMFCHKKYCLKNEKIQYKPLEIDYNSNESYDEFLRRSNQVLIYQKHLRALAKEMYKRLADINPDFMKPCFTIKEITYYLQNGCALKPPSTNSMHYGINLVLFRSFLLSNRLPLSVKQSQSLPEFKYRIKTLRNIACTWAICGT